MSSKYEKLKTLLRELFQLDQADLDFGIYRIMNQKRDEINRFLDQELLPQVKESFSQYQTADRSVLQKQLDETMQQLIALRVPRESIEQNETVVELRKKLSEMSVDVTALENEVYSHLYNFFRRYYDQGDFISMRRYKEGVYAIPYEGEEVKLHWANADQYYIKTSEYFRDYTFSLPSGKRAHFKLAEADTEKDNIKASDEKERRFILFDENMLTEEEGELMIRFKYCPDPEKRKQKNLNEQALQTIFEHAPKPWNKELRVPPPTESNSTRTLLEKHLNDYTARNTFDYFIHKDLGGFLRRELDFYIKNEVMRLDDVEEDSAPHVEQYLSKIKALRRIAHKIIVFLAQIEDFQKKLWLKKKFVVETNYCITLDRVPEELYPEICTNDAQRAEWVRLFAIDEIKGDLVKPGYSEPLTVGFLKDNPFLVLDTKFFNSTIKIKLIENCQNVENYLDGILTYGDNYQALRLLKTRFDSTISTIYLDPPYNTENDRKEGKFLYKDNFESSTWLTQMDQLIHQSYFWLNDYGAIFISCDENEYLNLGQLLTTIFSKKNHVETIIWNKRVPKNDKGIGNIHEYIYLYTKDLFLRRSADLSFIMRKDGLDEVYDLVQKCKQQGLSLEETQDKLKQFYRKNGFDRGITLYCELDGNYEIWGKINLSWPNPQTEGPRYEVINPVTGNPTPIPKNGWRWTEETFIQAEQNGPEFFLPDGSMMKGRIWYSNKDTVQPSSITYLHEVESFLLRSLLSVKSDGSLALESMGLIGLFDYPKSVLLMERLLYSTATTDGYIMDFFAGSGTTGHAVIKLNREDKGTRKYILIEMGEYFDTVTKPRIQKVIYSKDWKDGKPVSREGSSHCFKYMRLESYEDTLNNLTLQRKPDQQLALEQAALAFKEGYMLSYMLDVESKDSLLNIQSFVHPFDYQLNIATGSAGESKPTTIDLVETFNYLIGLRVETMQSIRGFRVITGQTPEGDCTLIIWRDLEEKNNTDLEEFFCKQDYGTHDMEFDLIYVNGDNNLENLRRPDETWKVRLIEEDFLRLMFEEQE